MGHVNGDAVSPNTKAAIEYWELENYRRRDLTR